MNVDLGTVHNAIAEAGKEAGFTKKKSLWSKVDPEVILLIEPQRSDWGRQYFINLGVYCRSLGDLPSPRAHQCHVYGRLESLLDENERMLLEAALNFETVSPAAGDRQSTVARILRSQAIPFLVALDSLSGFREVHAGGRLKHFGVVKELIAGGE